MEESNFVSNPSENTDLWFVWDMYDAMRSVVFLGSMEECGAVAGALNQNH